MNVNLLTVNMEKCVKCGVCIKACPAGIVQWGELGFPEVSEKHAGRCIGCGQCVLNCPACANELSFLKDSELARAEGLKLPSAEEALNLIMSRRSVRMFKDELVTRETFEKLFNAVRQAPDRGQQPERALDRHARPSEDERGYKSYSLLVPRGDFQKSDEPRGSARRGDDCEGEGGRGPAAARRAARRCRRRSPRNTAGPRTAR